MTIIGQRHGLDPFEQTERGRQAEQLLERALSEVQNGIDAIPTVSAALAALRIEAGELSEDELPPRTCTCEHPLSAAHDEYCPALDDR